MFDKLQQSIRNTCDMLDGYTIGTLIVEGGRAYMQTETGEEIDLQPYEQIEVYTGGEYKRISYGEVVSTVSSDNWPAYAGLDCRVKPIKLTLLTKEDFIDMENNAIVNVVLDLGEGIAETYTAYKLTDSGIYLTDIDRDGLAVISTLKWEEELSGYYFDKELFTLQNCGVVEEFIASVDDMPAEEILTLLLKYKAEGY
ncbi:hypothetical protein [Bacillus seohaeanensis]|uniref:DUF4178 domain-containing protein n=1 Tax=Bacillus seohaeanensis TaxID=284580 RepID=A0ABW5RU62_9BACI